MKMDKAIGLIFIVLVFVLSCVSAGAGDKAWTIQLNSTAEITAFKLTESNKAILLGITYIDPITQEAVFKVSKRGLPEGDEYWVKEYPNPIFQIVSTPQEAFFKITFYVGEDGPKITEIIDRMGKPIATLEQKKVFWVNDSYFMSAVDPEIGIDVYIAKFSTVMEIRSLPDNKLMKSIDIGGELIDVVPWGPKGLRMIVRKGRDQELLQSRDILSDPIMKIGDVSKNIPRDCLNDFFIDDSTIVSECYLFLDKKYALRISQDSVERLPLQFIRRVRREAEMPDEILYFTRYKGRILYFLNQGGTRVISTPINEDMYDPFEFLKRYSGDSEQIELERSAFYRIGEETFYLRIPPEEKNKIVIRKVE